MLILRKWVISYLTLNIVCGFGSSFLNVNKKMLPTGVDVSLNENAKSLVRRQTHLKSVTIATDSLQRTEPSEMLVELVDLSLNIETIITEF